MARSLSHKYNKAAFPTHLPLDLWQLGNMPCVALELELSKKNCKNCKCCPLSFFIVLKHNKFFNGRKSLGLSVTKELKTKVLWCSPTMISPTRWRLNPNKTASQFNPWFEFQRCMKVKYLITCRWRRPYLNSSSLHKSLVGDNQKTFQFVLRIIPYSCHWFSHCQDHHHKTIVIINSS